SSPHAGRIVSGKRYPSLPGSHIPGSCNEFCLGTEGNICNRHFYMPPLPLRCRIPKPRPPKPDAFPLVNSLPVLIASGTYSLRFWDRPTRSTHVFDTRRPGLHLFSLEWQNSLKAHADRIVAFHIVHVYPQNNRKASAH